MKTKFKMVSSIVSFLLLIPFRLPVSVMLIKLFNDIAQLEGTTLPYKVLLANVTLTKSVYNVVLAAILIYNIYHLFESKIKKEADKGALIVFPGIILGIYTIFDGHWTMELFKALCK